MLKSSRPAFTLSELLLVLLILGVISTFTIPKIITAQQNSHKRAVIRELVAALNDITYRATLMRDEELTTSRFYEYYRDHLNVVKKCSGNINTQGCWTQAFTSPNLFDSAGFVLHNGATLASFNDCCDNGAGQQGNAIAVDWNGPAGPNIYGQDQFDLVLSWGTEPITMWNPWVYRPGTVSPDYDEPASVTVFQEAFK